MAAVPPMTFGPGHISKVPKLAANLADGPVFIVSDAILEELGVTQHLTSLLQAQNIPHALAASVSGEPKFALIDSLCAQAREADAAVVVAIGGGAAMDAGKLVAAIARSGQPAETFALATRPLPTNGIPAIAVPTTAGTGSEVTRTSVISTADGSKSWFWGEELMFSQAVLDPELTVSLPPHITAWTGIDAIAHALEGATSRTTSPAGQLYGLEALNILAQHLPRAIEDGQDVETRARVLWASLVAGLALHNCNTHMGHNISHALGSLARVHHGLATGLALEASLPVLTMRPEGAENYARASVALGGASQPQALPGALSKLMRACGVAHELPAECANIAPETLANEMKKPANIGMSQNAACPLSDGDLDDLAKRMLQIPLAGAA
ncbi:MAG: iron-containing alcohol dehydrogenase [Pseudomonadota bacterium]